MKSKKMIMISIVLILIIAVAVIFYLNHPMNCGTSDNCFNTKAQSCKLVKADLEKQGNIFNYNILGKSGADCLVKVTLVKVNEEQPADLKKALEGKEMKCAVPQSLLKEREIVKINNLNDYCTGQLKETILSITVEKLYEVIVKNLGNITLQLANQKI